MRPGGFEPPTRGLEAVLAANRTKRLTTDDYPNHCKCDCSEGGSASRCKARTPEPVRASVRAGRCCCQNRREIRRSLIRQEGRGVSDPSPSDPVPELAGVGWRSRATAPSLCATRRDRTAVIMVRRQLGHLA